MEPQNTAVRRRNHRAHSHQAEEPQNPEPRAIRRRNRRTQNREPSGGGTTEHTTQSHQVEGPQKTEHRAVTSQRVIVAEKQRFVRPSTGVLQGDLPVHPGDLHQLLRPQVDGHPDADQDLRRYNYVDVINPKRLPISTFVSRKKNKISLSVQ